MYETFAKEAFKTNQANSRFSRDGFHETAAGQNHTSPKRTDTPKALLTENEKANRALNPQEREQHTLYILRSRFEAFLESPTVLRADWVTRAMDDFRDAWMTGRKRVVD